MKGQEGFSVIFGELPFFIEKTGIFDCAGVEIQNGIVREFGDLQGVARRRFISKSEAAVENDVAIRIEWVGINQDWNVIAGRISAAWNSEFVSLPMDWQLRCNAREQMVAARVAPKDEVIVGDIGIGNRRIVLHAGFATELQPPLADGIVHGEFGPVADFLVHWLSSGTDHDERIQEGVVNRTLQAVLLSQVIV